MNNMRKNRNWPLEGRRVRGRELIADGDKDGGGGGYCAA